MPDLRIVNADRATAETCLELICAAFELDIESARPLFHADPYFTLDDKWLLWDGERPVSTATVIPCRVNMGGWLMPCAGIAGVATDPEAHGRGYATHLLSGLLRALSSRGYSAAALLAARPELYRRVGFDDAARRWSIKFALSEVPGGAYPRDLGEQDRPSVMALHAAFGSHRLGALERDERRWRYFFWRNQLLVGVGRPLEQYMVYTTTPDGVFVKELNPAGPTDPMLRFLAGKGVIEVQGWREDVLAWRNAVAQRGDVGEPEPVSGETLMWRVVDAPSVLTELSRLRQSVRGEIALADDLIPANEGPWVVAAGAAEHATWEGSAVAIEVLTRALACGSDALPSTEGLLPRLLPPKRVFSLFPCDTF